jgi:hypothetical protein
MIPEACPIHRESTLALPPPMSRAFRQHRFHDCRHELRSLGGSVRRGRLPRLPAPGEQLLRRKPMSARDFRNDRARNERLFIRALSPAENHRRRPVPMITSSRRALVASGLSLWLSVDTTRSPIQRSHSSIVNVRKRCGVIPLTDKFAICACSKTKPPSGV